MKNTIILIALLGLVLLLASCKEELPPQLAGLADEASLNRLAGLPEGSDLLVSLHSDGVLGKIPDLGPDSRELGRFGPTKLVLLPRNEMPVLAKTEGLTGLVLWGDETALQKMDPLLRNELLGGMASPDWENKTYSALAMSADGAEGLKDSLTVMGARVGSASSGVVTLTAGPQVIFDILAMDELKSLKRAGMLQPK